jgi:hypothetical protein
MPSPYYRFVEFPFHFFDQERLASEKSKDLDVHQNNHWNRLVDIFEDSAHDFFSKFNYDITNAELFYTAPKRGLEWHIDMNPPEDFMKINFVWGSESHAMCWGELKNSSSTYETSFTKVSSQYIKLASTDIFLKKMLFVDRPVIVNVGRPHRIYNYSEKGRWCLSMILCAQGKRILFDDAVNTLSEYVVD